MGWSFTYGPYEQLIRELTRSYDTDQVNGKTIAHAIRNEGDYSVLWSVVELTAKQPGALEGLAPGQSTRFIRCDLIEHCNGQWGYKPLEEAMYPGYYSCPLSYLDMAPDQCPQWRDQVRAYHARRAANEGRIPLSGYRVPVSVRHGGKDHVQA